MTFPNNTRIQNWRIDDDGMLRVTAHVLKEGVYVYGAEESGLQSVLPGVDPVLMYVPASAFTATALASLEGKPVIVKAHEWRDVSNTLADGLTVGTMAGQPEVTADGCLACDMLIFDAETIRKITGKDLIEVSAGYNSVPEPGDGEFGGCAYHGTQRQLEFNHVLLLPEGKGRCGFDVRIVNQKIKENPMPNPSTLKVSIGTKRRSYRFSNEEDAAQAEDMRKAEQDFQAEALNAAQTELADLKNTLTEQTRLLEEARAHIEQLLAPETQEAKAREFANQKDDEEAIVNAEAEADEARNGAAEADEARNSVAETEKEKDAFGKALKACKTLAERRALIVSHVLHKRGQKAEDKSQEYVDGAFAMLAANARAWTQKRAREQATAEARTRATASGENPRILNGQRSPAGAPLQQFSNRERMLAPMKARNAKNVNAAPQ